MPDHSMTKTEKAENEKWRAESDVRTLAEAEEIKRDKPRHRRAISMAKVKIEELKNVTS